MDSGVKFLLIFPSVETGLGQLFSFAIYLPFLLDYPSMGFFAE